MTIVALTSDVHRGLTTKTHILHNTFLERLEADKTWDVLIIAGDIATTKTEQMKGFFRALRSIIQRPVVCVRGNHDYWNRKRSFGSGNSVAFRSLDYCNILHKEYFQRFDIHHLENNPYVINDVSIVGWDGWYTKPIEERNTNDHMFMPKMNGDVSSEDWLSKKASNDINEIINEVKLHNNVVLVSHMPILDLCNVNTCHVSTALPHVWSVVKRHIKAYCFGHIHCGINETIDGVRIFSPTVDYDKPNYLTFEV